MNQDTMSFLWYDYETFGRDSHHNRIASVAMVRTNLDFVQQGDPIVLYCKFGLDFLPSPEACLIHKLTPQIVNEKGISEYDLIRIVLREFSKPGTIVVGYNSNRFDDEITRSTLYRNLLNPYTGWEKNRWDIIKLVRAVRDYAPGSLVLDRVDNDTGNTSFKLPDVAEQNGIEQAVAHDALYDVLATIGIARKIREVQPDIYYWFFRHRTIDEINLLLKEEPRKQILLYTDSKPVNNHFTTRPIIPLFYEKTKNGVIKRILAFDLTYDVPEKLGGETNECLVDINMNACPFLANGEMKVDIEKHTGISRDVYLNRAKQVTNSLLFSIENNCRKTYDKASSDPDIDIYGRFPSSSERQKMDEILSKDPSVRLSDHKPFYGQDNRYNEILFRHVARNYPEVLSTEDQTRWFDHCRRKITGEGDATPAKEPLYISDYFRIIEAKEKEPQFQNVEDKSILSDLKRYGFDIIHLLGIQ